MCILRKTSVFVGHSKAPFPGVSEKEKNAWKLPNNTSAFNTSSDASLFSSSLPVLPHVKCKLSAILFVKNYTFLYYFRNKLYYPVTFLSVN